MPAPPELPASVNEPMSFQKRFAQSVKYHRQLGNERFGSSSLPVRQAGARARQPIFGSKSNFLPLFPQSETPEVGFSEF